MFGTAMSRASYHVRLATRDDSAQIESLWALLADLHAQLQPTFFERPSTVQPATRSLPRLLPNAMFVAVDDEASAIVGVVEVMLGDSHSDPGLVQARRGYVNRIVVGPNHRRRGIGRELMIAASDWLSQQKADQIILTIWSGNGEADGFYGSLGYRELGRLLVRRT